MPDIQISNSNKCVSQIGVDPANATIFKPYDNRFSRDRPTCFAFLIEQSGNLSGNSGGYSDKSKAVV